MRGRLGGSQERGMAKVCQHRWGRRGHGQSQLRFRRKEGAWPKLTLVQEEGGEGVLAPTGQLGPLPQPGTAHRENDDGVPKQTGGENPKVKAKPALPIVTAKCGPAPPSLWLNAYYNHLSEGELMDVDKVAWAPTCKRGGGEKRDWARWRRVGGRRQ